MGHPSNLREFFPLVRIDALSIFSQIESGWSGENRTSSAEIGLHAPVFLCHVLGCGFRVDSQCALITIASSQVAHAARHDE